MTNQSNYFTKTIFLATCLTIGCTGSGMAGCGSSDGSGDDVTVDSQLLGVYAVDSYRSSPVDPETGEPLPDSCDQLSNAPRFGDFIVLYSFHPNDNIKEARLGGVFCNDVATCKELAKAAEEPPIGYSFLQGDDENGWVGYGISRAGVSGDQCRADVQTHTLSASGDSINITTDTVVSVFPPSIEGETATCRNGDALSNLRPDLPCRSRLALEATRTSGL